MRLLSVILVASLLLEAGIGGQERTTPSPSTKQAKSSELVLDVNQATAEDFTKLPGIGPELARRIVAFRAKHGPFRRVEDLLAIRGIGHKKWRAIRPFLKVGGEVDKK